MSNPLYELQALILGSNKPPSSGKVVSINRNGIVVSTNKGTVIASNIPGYNITPGSVVAMQGDIITGISSTSGDIPEYRM